MQASQSSRQSLQSLLRNLTFIKVTGVSILDIFLMHMFHRALIPLHLVSTLVSTAILVLSFRSTLWRWDRSKPYYSGGIAVLPLIYSAIVLIRTYITRSTGSYTPSSKAAQVTSVVAVFIFTIGIIVDVVWWNFHHSNHGRTEIST